MFVEGSAMNGITRRACATGLVLGGAYLAAVSAAAVVGDGDQPDLAFVHPELRPFAAGLLKQAGGAPETTRATLPAVRMMMNSMRPPLLSAPPFQKQSIKGLSGMPDVTVFVINAQPGQRKPAIIHTHGGGFISGSAEGMIGALQPTAAELDCVVVTVEYRLAPETTFEGSVADNYAALKWVHDNADVLGVDRHRIAVMGESAGGGHAALLAIMARDRGEVPVMFQALIYPMLDDRTGSARQPALPTGSILWTPTKNRFGWECFLGQVPGTASVPARAVPARQVNLKGLPPAFIGVGTIDLFVDEDMEYARRLIDTGIPTQFVTVPGAFHSFDRIAANTALSKRFTEAKLNALRQAFSNVAA
jgi:acetyl esterase/lipase